MILVIFSLLLNTLSKNSDCLDQMKLYSILPTPASYALAKEEIGLSGNWAYQYGYYDQCLMKGYHYTSAKFKAYPNQMEITYGFCHTNKCNSEDFNSEEGQMFIKKYLNQSLIPEMLQIDVMKSTFEFYNPLTYFPDKSLGTYITPLLLSFFLFLGLLDPIHKFICLLLNKPLASPEGFIHNFSLIENYNRFFIQKPYDPNLQILNGMRAISFLMVLFGHSAMLMMSVTFQYELWQMIPQWKVLFAVNMFYSVDIFFWLGGFFLSYVMCESSRAKALRENPRSLIIIFIHRLFRIYPCYIVCILINTFLLPYTGGGPRWWQAGNFSECQPIWWRNLLFIDNIFEKWDLCFGWGWYLTCDIQLFLISLIPMMIFSKGYKMIAKIFISVMFITCLIYGIVICYQNEYLIPAKTIFNPTFYKTYYINSIARSPPYFLGLLLGLFYREHKEQLIPNFVTYLSQCAQNQRFRILFQIICYSIGLIIIYQLFFCWKDVLLSENPDYWPKWFEQLYCGGCRTLFVVAISLVCFPNFIGIHDMQQFKYFSFNTRFMNNVFFMFIAKISFLAYLIHLIVLFYLNSAFYITPTYLLSEVIYFFVGSLVITLILAFLLTILIEMPFSRQQDKLMSIIRRTKEISLQQ